jgi:hypothetical protein
MGMIITYIPVLLSYQPKILDTGDSRLDERNFSPLEPPGKYDIV